MSIDIHLDRDRAELEAARAAVVGAIVAAAELPPGAAEAAAAGVLKALAEHWGGTRVYWPMRHAQKLPEDQLRAIEDGLLSGLGVREVARRVKCHHSTVIRIRRRLREQPLLAAVIGDGTD